MARTNRLKKEPLRGADFPHLGEALDNPRRGASELRHISLLVIYVPGDPKSPKPKPKK